MKRLILLILILSLGLLAGCFPTDDVGKLTLSVPDSAYPPATVTLVASGVIGGQFTFTVEGKTYTQTGNELTVTIDALPCTVEVVWESDAGDYQTDTARIGLANTGPVPGRPMLNFIKNLWTIQPRSKYTVTFPDAYDPQGGDVVLVNVTVFHTGQQLLNTVFCPPYIGMNPPKPDVYHVGVHENAFIFFSTWNGGEPTPYWLETLDYMVGDRIQYGGDIYECLKNTDEAIAVKRPGSAANYWNYEGPIGTTHGLPYPPPSQSLTGYPGRPTTCPPLWSRGYIPSGVTVITATFKDELGATTTESWEIPTVVFPGC